MSGGVKDMLYSTMEYADPDNPGGGWIAIGGISGSFIGGFAAAFLVAMGIMAAIVDVLLCTPILIGWIIWKKSGNRKAYTICFIIPGALISLCMIATCIANLFSSFSMLLV